MTYIIKIKTYTKYAPMRKECGFSISNLSFSQKSMDSSLVKTNLIDGDFT